MENKQFHHFRTYKKYVAMLNPYIYPSEVPPILDMQMNGSSVDLYGHTVTDTAMTYDANNAIFNGTTSKIVVSSASDLSFTNGTNDLPFTLKTKIRLASVNATSQILFEKDGYDEYQLLIASSLMRIYFFDAVLGGYLSIWWVATISAGVDYELDIVYTGVGNASGISLYVNKVLATTSIQSGGSYSRMRIGSYPVNIGRILNGSMDYFKIYNYAKIPV